MCFPNTYIITVHYELKPHAEVMCSFLKGFTYFYFKGRFVERTEKKRSSICGNNGKRQAHLKPGA